MESLNSEEAPLVIGHGAEYSEYEPPKETDISHYTDEQLSAFCDAHSPEYESAVKSAHRYYNLSFKDTHSCIEMHQSFLDSLYDVTKIIILGHSLNDIDYPYFELLSRTVKPDCFWAASFYPENEKETMWDKLEGIVGDVSRMELFKMSDLVCSK